MSSGVAKGRLAKAIGLAGLQRTPENQRVKAAEKPIERVNVRDLVDFVLRTGDLGRAETFVGRDRALAGVRGHQRIQRARPPGYEREVPVRWEREEPEFRFRVEGRVDGVLRTEETLEVEEIKTVQNGWEGVPDPLHWAQARAYAAMLLVEEPVRSLATIQLTYLDLDTGETSEFREESGRNELLEFFQNTVAVYLEWLRAHRARCARRDESIRGLAFPYQGYRPGQRQLMVEVYKAVKRAGRVYIEAPTGIGKTVSALYPALKALGEHRMERIFYLTARGTGRAVAERAAEDMERAGLGLARVSLTAREKICRQAQEPCGIIDCPLAKGYYDRRKPAMRAALERGRLDRGALEEVATHFQVCPFELALDVSMWADLVICDYNYVFDPQASLRRHFGDGPSNVLLLVDEAHNLVDRAREMFSAGLSGSEMLSVQRAVRARVPACARALSKLRGSLRELAAEEPGGAGDFTAGESEQAELFEAHPGARLVQSMPATRPRIEAGVRVLRELPEPLTELVERVLKASETWLCRNEKTEFREPLLQLFFKLLAFRRTMDQYDPAYATLVRPGPDVELFCLDPSKRLRETVENCQSSVFFSATLSPGEYYRELLGGSAEDTFVQFPSPFAPENLGVLVQEGIATRYKDREQTAAQVAETVAAVVRQRKGNYLVYFPSYEYLRRVQETFTAHLSGVRQRVQRPGMSEEERDAFLAEFSEDHPESLVGWAVLGGVFGEGVDLTGDRLIGAVVVGVGLPQLSAERDLIRDYFEAREGRGFDYAYTYPGMNRILQAVGRVIRSETDRGLVVLIDTRYREERYRRLFPMWWRPQRVRSVGELMTRASAFWVSNANARRDPAGGTAEGQRRE